MTCAYCGKKKSLPKRFYADRSLYERDPYCSRACAEADQAKRKATA